MSVITHHTQLPDEAEKTDFYGLVDNSTCTGIINDDIASSAAITDIKLDTIKTNGKVKGTALVELNNIPAGAGQIPSANLANAFPSGGIIIWSGSIVSIPSGWYLCDGNNGTPNLTDKFIMGAGNTYSVGGSGGSTTKNIQHTHALGTTTQGGDASDYVQVVSGVLKNEGSDTYSNTIVTDTTASGGSTSMDVLNPYYALAFIMKA